MRIALLNPVYWPEVRRGSERFARELADGLLELGHHPVLITSHPHRTSRSVEDGLEVLRLRRPPGEGRLRRKQFQEHLTHVPLAYLALRRGRFDVAHALHISDALAALRWQEHTGRPALVSIMGMPERDRLVALRKRVEIMVRVARGCRAAVVLSQAAADAMERQLGVRPRVIYPGVDLAAFTPDPAARASDPTIFCAAQVGDPRKRVGLLVAAFGLLRRELPAARLVLSRPRGPEGGPFEGIEGVELRDVDDRAALAAAYREAHVSVLASTGEAFGLVLVESLACGTPVVGARSGAIPEVLDGATIGRLFDGEDPAALATALREALTLVPDAAQACRARAQEFSAARTAQAYAALYREVGA